MGSSNIDCVEKVSDETPDTLVDTSTLTIDIDNMGLARLSISVMRKGSEGLILGDCSISLGENRVFKGYIVSDYPQQVPGTEYFDHKISALGTIQEGGSGGSPPVAA